MTSPPFDPASTERAQPAPDPVAGARALPLCSVVIPARDAEATLPRTLAALAVRPAHWEVILVDDHSSDRTAAIGAEFGVRVVRAEARGVSAARNTGAVAARGRLVAFLDADVVVQPEVIEAAFRRVDAGEDGCIFAVYDLGAHLAEPASAYKNFWIRHTTLAAPRPLRWVNTSLAVMRRRDYRRAGGFRGGFPVKRGGGDLDFGRRLAQAGVAIVADTRIEVSHLKRVTVLRLVRNDFLRARGWLRLALASQGFRATLRRPGLANVRPGFALSAFAGAGAILAAAVAGGGSLLRAIVPAAAAALPAAVPAGAWLSAAALGAIAIGSNAGFLVAALRERPRFWPLFPALLLVDQAACAAGVACELTVQAARRLAPGRAR